MQVRRKMATGRTESETVALALSDSLKMQHTFYFHSSRLHPGEMEREVPALTIRHLTTLHSMFHVCHACTPN